MDGLRGIAGWRWLFILLVFKPSDSVQLLTCIAVKAQLPLS
jgi:hypothetical protein